MKRKGDERAKRRTPGVREEPAARWFMHLESPRIRQYSRVSRDTRPRPAFLPRPCAE